ncbi:MAG: hypothetical protein HY841_03040 [Bacteroidetes bacterium]|nr:hypothetical protein [Bacteroidota bacterium]
MAKKKKSKTETGHAKNVANLNVMISRLQGYGTRYNPTNPLIKIPNLQTAFTSGSATMTTLDNVKPAYTKSVDDRQQIFTDMEKLSTRIINSFHAIQGITKAQVEDVKTIIRKIRGVRKDKIVDTPPPADATEKEIEKHISASQKSYDQLTEHFTKLTSLVASVPAYAPNEIDLKNTALATFLSQLKAANQAVINATTPYLTAMQNRNNILYNPVTGIKDLAAEVKKYVKSVSTITLAEFRQISGLKFTRPREKK